MKYGNFKSLTVDPKLNVHIDTSTLNMIFVTNSCLFYNIFIKIQRCLHPVESLVHLSEAFSFLSSILAILEPNCMALLGRTADWPRPS